MDFERINNNKEEKRDNQEIIDFFSKPLAVDEVNTNLDSVAGEVKMHEDLVIWRKKISNDLNFEVCSNGPFISFYLTDKTGERLLNFKYRKLGNELSQEHRETAPNLSDYDINGSLFLQKAEEFLTIMVNKSPEKINHFLINSGQKQVIDWALKNGYHFRDIKQEEKYQDVLSDNDNYAVSDNFSYGNKYQTYIFEKDNIKKAENYLNEQLNNGEERENIDLRSFSERFDLIKDIPKVK